jgi:hypothetical protein
MAKDLEEAVKKSTRERTSRQKEKESVEWLRAKARTAAKENKQRRAKRKSNLLGDESKFATQLMPGQMYFYNYDAKYKAELDYYDTYPCIMLLDVDGKGHFLGLNLHYLPPILRAKLLDAIMDLPKTKTKKQLAIMSYNIVKSFAASSLAMPCLHKYLFSHVKSPIIEIQRSEWNYVAMLPLAHFVSETGSASLTRVYSDSRRKM